MKFLDDHYFRPDMSRFRSLLLDVPAEVNLFFTCLRMMHGPERNLICCQRRRWHLGACVGQDGYIGHSAGDGRMEDRQCDALEKLTGNRSKHHAFKGDSA